MVPALSSNNRLDTAPKVSVSLVTYNQKKFIAQAIESVLEQQTDFPYELIIGDDFSTDGTREIIRTYYEKYPEIIVPILHKEKNPGLGGKLNFISTIDAARGEYVALLDGDDYWQNPKKLQTQVDFLDANPDFSICFHAIQFLYDGQDGPTGISNVGQASVTTFEDLAKGNYIHTPSCVYRNRLFGKLPAWYLDTHAGDFPLHLLNAQHGKIKFLPDAMSVYRIHSGGVWASKGKDFVIEKTLPLVDTLQAHFAPRGHEEFEIAKSKLRAELCFNAFERNDIVRFRELIAQLRPDFGRLDSRTARALRMRRAMSHLPFVGALYGRLRRSKTP